MSKQYVFIVEGYHDVAIITKLLKVNGYKEVKKTSQLTDTFNKLLPNKFPFIENRLNIFNVIPMFMKKGDIQIVIKNAVGETNLFHKLDMMLSGLELDEIQEITQVVVFADGDMKDRDEKLNSILACDFKDKGFEFVTKEDVSYPSPNISIMSKFKIPLDYYIFPDNKNAGRLENVIIDSINESDKKLANDATSYVENIDGKYTSSWNKGNSKREKALIGVAGNVLLPGCSNTTILYSDDVDWISTEALKKLDTLKKLNDYLQEIL